MDEELSKLVRALFHVNFFWVFGGRNGWLNRNVIVAGQRMILASHSESKGGACMEEDFFDKTTVVLVKREMMT